MTNQDHAPRYPISHIILRLARSSVEGGDKTGQWSGATVVL